MTHGEVGPAALAAAAAAVSALSHMILCSASPLLQRKEGEWLCRQYVGVMLWSHTCCRICGESC